MFKVFADGDDRLRLEDPAGRRVGWIRGHTIGFDGLASEKAGGSEWVADGYRPLARLLRPLTGRNSADSFALEFFVPSYATQHVTIAAAQAVGEVPSKYKPAASNGSAVRAK